MPVCFAFMYICMHILQFKIKFRLKCFKLKDYSCIRAWRQGKLRINLGWKKLTRI